MLVVIGIIAVLVSIGAVSYSTAQKKARDARRKIDIGAIKDAMEQYYSLCNSAYPFSDGGMVPGTIQASTADGCSSDTVILQTVPTDPKTADRYDYNDGGSPPSICATAGGGTVYLMETEGDLGSPFCVYLQQ